MKIIFNEAKKLFNPVLLVMLIIFTFIFYKGFFALGYWPQFQVESPWNTEVYSELAERVGPTLSRDEMPQFYEFRDEIVSQVNAELQKSEIFKENGIETYEQYIEVKNGLRTKDASGEEFSGNDEEVLAEADRYMFRVEPASELLFKLQDLSKITRLIDIGKAFATDETIKILDGYLSELNPEMAEMIREKCFSDEISLLPATPSNVVENDSLYLTIISCIAVFSAVILMLITDRLRGIYPIALSSKIGRKIFKIQAAVCGIFGLLAGALACLIYGAALMNKGAGVFLNCPMDNFYHDMWVKISYRQYLIIMAAAVIIFSGVAGLLSYIIGRFATNYISGLAVSIPTLVALCAAKYFSTAGLFSAQRTWTLSRFWSSVALPFLIILPICIGVTAAVCLILKRDGRRDIL